MGSPYREAPQVLMCPRCDEVLDSVFGGVAVCTRCEGAWVQQAAVTTAFGNPRWPVGQNLWWRAELDCPECAVAGTTTRMDARDADNIMVDLCPTHGVWLDHGELARLMQLGEGSDELLALQSRVSVGAPDPEGLARRRLLWRTDIAEKRKRTAELDAWLEAEEARKAAEAAAAAKRRAEAEAEAKRRADAAAEAAAAAARAEEQRKQEALEKYQALVAKRANTIKDRDGLQGELVHARAGVTSLEIRLAEKVAELEEIENKLKGAEAETK